VIAAGAVSEVYLQPGGLWFGDGDVRLRTLLGSCVAITLWHPRQRCGGMCHFMLPGRPAATHTTPADGRYAAEAMDWLVQRVAASGLHLVEFQAKLFGGGRMYPDGAGRLPSGSMFAVHERNVDAARALLTGHRLVAVAEHLGGVGHRELRFELATGEAWLRHTVPRPQLRMAGGASA
jgi:chemotaxis protein CheD